MTELHRLRAVIESHDGLLSQAEIERYVDLLANAHAPSARLSSCEKAGGTDQRLSGRGRERIAYALRSRRSF